MANDTKERILAAALEMFSKNGYAGTNIRELSASLGLVKSGVYKHYESKEAIWNALLDQMIAYYGEHFGSSEHLPPVPDSLEALTRLTMQMVNITVHDEKINPFIIRLSSISTAESVGTFFVCEYPHETNGTSHVPAISREKWLNEITERSTEKETGDRENE